MAHIRQRNNAWKAEVQVGKARTAKSFKTKEAAEAWAADKEDRLRERRDMTAAMAERLLMSRLPRRVLEAASRIPYTHSEVVRNPIPAAVMSGVYFLISNGEVCYVGQSVDVLHRLARHRREGRVFDSFNVITCDREAMDELESLYISAFMPPNNRVIGNPTRVEAKQEAP